MQRSAIFALTIKLSLLSSRSQVPTNSQHLTPRSHPTFTSALFAYNKDPIKIFIQIHMATIKNQVGV